MKKFLQPLFVLLTVSGLAACSNEKSLEALSDVSSDSHYTKTPDISYGPDPRQKMDLYVPDAGDSSLTESGVTVVFIYGGAWRTGSKAGYEFVASPLTKAGHRVLIPDYRLYPQVRYPDFIDDIAQAIAAFESSSYSQDAGTPDSSAIDKLVLMGHSSGAHQAALLLTDPQYFERANVSSDIKGFIGLSGPYDLPLDLEEVSVVFPNVQEPLIVNPVLQVSAMQPGTLSGVDVLLLHGATDERVLPFHTREFAESLEDSGASVSVHSLKGGHAPAVLALSGPLEFLNDAQEYVLELLETIAERED